jgi:SAM-dependent methyltransferase
MLHPLFANDGLTLDVGAGTGIVAAHLARLGRRVVGIDRSHDMLRKAQTRLGGRFAAGDAARLPVRSDSVDDAYSVWLLHLVDVPTVLGEVARVVRPGGRYLVTPTSDGSPGEHPVRRITEEMARRLRGGGERQDAPERVRELAAGFPFRPAGIVDGERQTFTTTPRDAAGMLERRAWFMVQGVGDDVWAAVVEPAIEALRALPGQDEAVTYEVRPRVLVLERI